jgi:hypothetical protein
MRAPTTIHRVTQSANGRLPTRYRTNPAVAHDAAVRDGIPVDAIPAPLRDLALLLGIHLRRFGNPRLLRPA